MSQLLDPVLILVLALNFFSLGVSRIQAVIVATALQGILLAVSLLLAHPVFELRVFVLMAVMIALKGYLIPTFLMQAMSKAQIQHEDPPFISYTNSLLLGAVGTGLVMEFSSRLPLAPDHTNSLIVPASLATVWTGFLMLTTRHFAIMQVLGYLLLENGIFLFGLLLLEAMPMMVEIGVLLDLFTGVFVMVIIINHISREFSSTSTEHLSSLKE